MPWIFALVAAPGMAASRRIDHVRVMVAVAACPSSVIAFSPDNKLNRAAIATAVTL